MSYTPNTWTTGDVITAAKLNNMEQGIASAGGGLVLRVTRTPDESGYICDKTWLEIYNALTTVPVSVVFIESDGDYNEIRQNMVNDIAYDGTDYYITIADFDFIAASPDSYPQFVRE